MRKYALVFVLVVLLWVFTTLGAFAQNVENLEKRNAFEFCELYTMRLNELKQSYNIDATFDMSTTFLYRAMPYTNFLYEEGQYSCEVPAGTIVVSMPNFDIEEASCVVYEFGKEDSRNDISIYRAAMMYAALEYNGFDDEQYEYLSHLGTSQYTSVIERAYDEFETAMMKCFNDPSNQEVLRREDGSRIAFMSRNYEYSVYRTVAKLGDQEKRYLYMVAEANREQEETINKQKKEPFASENNSVSASGTELSVNLCDHIIESVESYIRNYDGTSLIRLDINPDLSSLDEKAIIVNIRLKWDMNNGIVHAKKKLEDYSNEIVTNLTNGYSDKHITAINLFWEAPRLINTGYAAKYMYKTYEDDVRISDMLGPIYGVN